jgi:hypothetical protein
VAASSYNTPLPGSQVRRATSISLAELPVRAPCSPWVRNRSSPMLCCVHGRDEPHGTIFRFLEVYAANLRTGSCCRLFDASDVDDCFYSEKVGQTMYREVAAEVKELRIDARFDGVADQRLEYPRCETFNSHFLRVPLHRRVEGDAYINFIQRRLNTGRAIMTMICCVFYPLFFKAPICICCR